MGNCVNKGPTDMVELSSTQVRDLLSKALNTKALFVGDRDYATYSKRELQEFLKKDNTDSFSYNSESFDCDDFATVLMGREKEWYMFSKKKRASCFGIVHGDIRKNPSDTEIRPHAMNVYIDETLKVWLIEPQTDEFFEPNLKSTFWFVLI